MLGVNKGYEGVMRLSISSARQISNIVAPKNPAKKCTFLLLRSTFRTQLPTARRRLVKSEKSKISHDRGAKGQSFMITKPGSALGCGRI